MESSKKRSIHNEKRKTFIFFGGIFKVETLRTFASVCEFKWLAIFFPVFLFICTNLVFIFSNNFAFHACIMFREICNELVIPRSDFSLPLPVQREGAREPSRK
jgi:hypothetical protein